MKMENKFNIRKSNIVEILTLLFNNPNISRIDISKMINLNKASVSEIINLLIEKNLVVEIGNGNSGSSGGRKPILLKINEKSGCSLSIDLGIDYVSYLLLDLNKNVLKYNKSYIKINKDNTLSIITNIINSLKYITSNYIYNLVGISIAIHGRVLDDEIKFTPYYDLDKFNLKEKLAIEFPKLDITLENESNLAAIGEFENSKEDLKNSIIINVHSGIGAGIIINSELYTGFEGRAGEIGHMILVPNGRDCPCGNKGCFEQYCSIPAIINEFNLLSNISINTIDELCNLYNDNDIIATNIINNNIKLMATGITNIFNLFAPDSIYLHSDLVEFIPNYIDLINNEIDSFFSKNLKLLPNKLNGKSNLYGGAIISIYKFFNKF